MLVSQILKIKGAGVVSVPPEATVTEAARVMMQHKVGAVVVVSAEGELRGIFSERDLARGVATHGRLGCDAPVTALMTPEVVTCSLDDSSDRLMEQMSERRFRHLPVMAGGQLVGMISIGDVVKARLSELQNQAAELQAYIATG